MFFIALLGTVIATPLSMKLAWRVDAVDYPDGRRVNTKPTPRLGGVALFVGIALAAAFVVIFKWVDPTIMDIRGFNKDINYYGVGLAVLVIFVTGLIDDIYQIKAWVKLIGQIIAASIACYAGVLFSHFLNPFAPGMIELGLWAYPVTVFYLVAFANIINLIDGLDGLASGVVVICAAALFYLSLSRGGVDAAIVAIALIGACLGFLIFNFYPAKIFLGDSGALMLGFGLGLVSLFGVVRASALVSLLIPVVIAGVPVLDTFTSIIRRLRSGSSIFSADKQHIHHRFINLGFSQRTTVLIIYGMSIILSILGILIAQDRSIMRIVYIILLLVIVALFIWRLGLMSSVLTHHYEGRQGNTSKRGIPKGEGSADGESEAASPKDEPPKPPKPPK